MTIVNINFPNQVFEEIEDEYWRPLICHGEVVPHYYVSNYGNITGKKGKKLKWSSRGGYPSVNIQLPSAEFAGHTYSRWGGRSPRTRSDVHILVATAFLPLDEHIPEELDEYVEIDGKTRQIWSLLPDHTKLWIRDLLIVDHIDNNKANPHVSNLTFTTNRKNNKYVKAQLSESSC